MNERNGEGHTFAASDHCGVPGSALVPRSEEDGPAPALLLTALLLLLLLGPAPVIAEGPKATERMLSRKSPRMGSVDIWADAGQFSQIH